MSFIRQYLSLYYTLIANTKISDVYMNKLRNEKTGILFALKSI